MRWTLAVLATGCLLLAGCGSDPVMPSATQVGGVASAEDLPSTDSNGTLPDADFLSLVRDNVTFYAKETPDLIVRDAKMLCGVFNPSQGGDAITQFSMVIKVLTALGMEAKETGVMLVFSTAQYCPEESGHIPRS